MTDLIDRIRAYVAAIPTHECAYCHADWIEQTQQGALACANCGKRFWVAKDESPAGALLREVAALEPVSYARVHDKRNPHFGDVVLPDSQEAEMWAYDLIPIYTLTGATHD